MAYLLQFTILGLIFALSFGQVLKITPDVSDLLVKEGDQLELKCTSSSSNSLEWKFAGKDGPGYSKSAIFSNGIHTSTLKLSNFTSSLAGQYQCEQIDGTEIFNEDIILISVAETKVEPTYEYGNESAKLSCSITTSGSVDYTVEKVTWKKGDKPVSSLGDRFEEEAGTLIIKNPMRDDIGNYTAEIKMDKIQDPYKCEVSFKEQAVQFNPTKVEAIFAKGMEVAALSCSLDGGRKIEKVEWFKNDTKISKLEKPDRFNVHTENNTLVIDQPERKDAGLYISRFTLEDLTEPYDCKVNFRAAPEVLKFPKSKNLIEKDKMELQCQVEGFPKPEVTWFKNKVALNVSQDERIELHALQGNENARLVIKNIEFSDEGDYSCKAYSSYFNVSSEKDITVRVKDKLAALWPFLGIVCEVIILCIIIFIYEKRRNKRAEQEENKAQEADGPSMEKKDGLRHRGTSGNPGA